MLTREELSAYLQKTVLLDGATGSNLQKAGMPRGCCTEEWILANPPALVALQRRYADAGSHILYAPTFQAQPIALEKVNLHKQAEAINAQLVALTRSAVLEKEFESESVHVCHREHGYESVAGFHIEYFGCKHDI